MENKTDMVLARDLKLNVETAQQGRRRQWKVVVRSMGLGVAHCLHSMACWVSQGRKNTAQFLRNTNLTQRSRQS